jgi:hypothetical protein
VAAIEPLVAGEKIWEAGQRRDPALPPICSGGTTAATHDIGVTPRPIIGLTGASSRLLHFAA